MPLSIGSIIDIANVENVVLQVSRTTQFGEEVFADIRQDHPAAYWQYR